MNVELDNRHSAQHSMSSSTIDIQLNIQCPARHNRYSAKRSSNECLQTSQPEFVER